MGKVTEMDKALLRARSLFKGLNVGALCTWGLTEVIEAMEAPKDLTELADVWLFCRLVAERVNLTLFTPQTSHKLPREVDLPMALEAAHRFLKEVWRYPAYQRDYIGFAIVAHAGLAEAMNLETAFKMKNVRDAEKQGTFLTINADGQLAK